MSGEKLAIFAVGRGPIILSATALIAVWLIFAFIWWIARQGENVHCCCWADNHGTWEYTAQFLRAAVGSTALVIAVASYVTGERATAIGGFIVALAAAGCWTGLFVTATPNAHIPRVVAAAGPARRVPPLVARLAS